MIDRPFASRIFGFLFLLALPGSVEAQVGSALYPGGPGLGWRYPGLSGGPFVAFPGVSGAYGNYWANGPSFCGPPIATYGPIPDSIACGKDHTLQPGFGWFGVYGASPRPRPPTVSVWPRPIPEPVPVLPVDTPSAPGGCLILSVKVPQHAAEVFVNGVRTMQTGRDRMYESPPLDGGKEYRYDLIARWVEGGAMIERKMAAAGKPGDVVRVDFDRPDELPVLAEK